MRALEPEVANVVWEAAKALIPSREDNHPLGCHDPRIPDRVCFQGILIRLVTGCSWETAEQPLGAAVSDTTLRARRDQWIEAGVFENLETEALAAYDRIVGLDLSDVSVDGSGHKAPCGGQGTGKNPCDRAKSGWKWSLAVDKAGIPVGWATDGANRHDSILFEPTLDSAADRGLRTNSWLTNYGQLRRNTDRSTHHRHAQLNLAITLIITIKLIKWRDRWNPTN